MGANPREISDYVKTDLKRIALTELVEAEVLPYMSNHAVREEIKSVITDSRYQLSPEEFRAEIQKDKSLKNLILERNELYQGQWDLMIADLKNRLKSRPYIFQKVKNIAINFPHILHLRFYEAEQKALDPEFNLTNLLPEE